MIYALDSETGPFDPSVKQTNSYALEPYREEFYTKLVAIVGKDGYHQLSENFKDTLHAISGLDNPIVYCHNAIFDISVLIRHLGYENIKHITFRDTGLLAKWVHNSQKDEHFRYSLRNCIEKWLPDHPDTQDFLNMKDNMENSYEYWLERVMKDTELTLDLAIALQEILPKEQRNGFTTECKCLLPLARGYMQGICIDPEVVEEMRVTYGAKIKRLLRELDLQESVIRSPVKLGQLLFVTWGLKPEGVTPSGNASTSAPNLKMIQLKSGDARLSKLLEVKTAMTVMSKYVQGYIKTMDYIGMPVMHPVPRLFNSYTGRMTYTSKMMKKYQVGIALHQLPRKDKLVKKAMVAPKGYKFFYADFAAQEMRLMAQYSKDSSMNEAFNDGVGLHSITTETIFGIPYEEIEEGNKNGDADIVDKRNCGKLTNLSSQYRIGAKSLQTKFFEQYNKVITMREATHYLNSYKKSYPGVVRFWDVAVNRVKAKKYSESLMNRRYYINKLDWQGESSSINQPIQGSGADLAEILIGETHERFPDAIFQVQVHDSLTWIIPEEQDVNEFNEFINTINFQKYVNQNLTLQFPLDAAVGYNLGDMKPL
jgi:DNA polymerase I-like protein with 3'-5' exonuclease and polymerase domains